MKPNFALSLSFDGISLLQRVPTGWVHVQDVALDSADLSGEMSALRATADTIAPDGGMVKIVLPNEQIKVLTIPDPSQDHDTREAAVKHALEGATPYAVADLAYDWSPLDGQIQIAAVALETLAEAEEFTTSHHFDPVCFVAAVSDGSFDGEVFFGAAEAWIKRGGPAPVRDDMAVHLVDAPVAAETRHQDLSSDMDAEALSGDVQSEAREAEPDGISTAPAEPEVSDQPQSQRLDDVAAAPIDPKPAPTFSSRRGKQSTVVRDQRGGDHGGDNGADVVNEGRQSGGASARHRLGKISVPDMRSDAPRPAEFRDKPKRDMPRPKIEGVTAAELPKDVPKRKAKAAKAERRAGLFGARRKKAENPRSKTSAGVATKREAPVAPLVAARLQSATAAAPAEDPAQPMAAPALGQAATLTQSNEERHRMALFGTREAQAARIGGKPRFLGLILTTALLLALAGVAAWASVYLDQGLSRFFPGAREETAIAGLPAVPSIDTESPVDITDEPVEVAALDPDLDDAPITDALTPVVEAPAPQQISQAEAEATYAATGIWSMAPDAPSAPRLESRVGFDEASIDGEVLQVDAVALPQVSVLIPDASIGKQASPVAFGTVFDLDERGLVRATLEGAVNPDGVRIYAGLPPVVPPLRDTTQSVTPAAVEQALALARLEEVRPRLRPQALLEASERVAFGGLSRIELSNRRPLARPVSETERLEDEASLDATRLAVGRSLKPLTRPKNFAAVVEAAEGVKVAALQVPVQPRIPSSASVSKQATVTNAIALSRINLIGVYGKPESRRALVRLSNGKYKKVQVGDKLDGGQVAAIGETELRYVKRGRNLVLEMPNG